MSRSALARQLQRRVAESGGLNAAVFSHTDPFDFLDAYTQTHPPDPGALPIRGDLRTFNLDGMLARNIVSRPSFAADWLPVDDMDALIDAVYEYVTHLSPWDNVHTRVASPAFTAVYRLAMLRPSARDVTRMLTHRDSPYIRAVALLFLRYCAEPSSLWKWLYLLVHDPEPLSVDPATTRRMPLGAWLREHVLSEDGRYMTTVLPRLPVAIGRDIGVHMLLAGKDDERATANRPHASRLVAGARVRARWSEDGKMYDAEVTGPASDKDTRVPDCYWVTYTEFGNSELVWLGAIDMRDLVPAAAVPQAAGRAASPSRADSRTRAPPPAQSRSRSPSRNGRGYDDRARARRSERSRSRSPSDARPRRDTRYDDAPRDRYVDHRDDARGRYSSPRRDDRDRYRRDDDRGARDRSLSHGRHTEYDRDRPRHDARSGWRDRDAPVVDRYQPARRRSPSRSPSRGEPRRRSRSRSHTRTRSPPHTDRADANLRSRREDDDDDIDRLRREVEDRDRRRAVSSGGVYGVRPVGFKEALSLTVDSYAARKRSASPVRTSYHDAPVRARAARSRSPSPPPAAGKGGDDHTHTHTHSHAQPAAAAAPPPAPSQAAVQRYEQMRAAYEGGAGRRTGRDGAPADGEDVIRVSAW